MPDSLSWPGNNVNRHFATSLFCVRKTNPVVEKDSHDKQVLAEIRHTT